VRQIARVIGWEGNIVVLPSEQLPEPLRSDALDLNQQYAVDSSRIRRELGYAEVVPFDEALQRTIEWERANPPEKVNADQFSYDLEDTVLSKLKE
jgi:nucleoside-diphosphate-sugar epimerase